MLMAYMSKLCGKKQQRVNDNERETETVFVRQEIYGRKERARKKEEREMQRAEFLEVTDYISEGKS